MAALVCVLLLSASGATVAAVPRALLRASSMVAAAGTPLVTRNVTFDTCCQEQPICCRYPATCCL